MTPCKTPRLVALSMIALAGAASLLLAWEALAPSGANGHAEDLQRLVGGLGCGPAVDLSRCAFSFDPRLCADCSQNQAPVPGGVYFCPQHACSILYCRPLTTQSGGPAEEDGNGRTP